MKKIIFGRAAIMAVLLLGMDLSRSAWAQTAPTTAMPMLRVLRPVPNAVVRETVPVRIAPADLPADGYVGVTIDGIFRTARVLPPNKTGLIFQWDTKASYTTPDQPDMQKFIADGNHSLKLDLFDRSGTLLGDATVSVRVANKIIVPAQGIKLAYLWKADQDLHYLHQTELNYLGGGTAGAAQQNLQASLIQFSRSVEDATGGDFLVRDSILPASYVIDHGQTQAVQSSYNIKSLYRTVDTRGNVLRSMAALTPGQHIGFSIPVLPARRVAVGDSWQSPTEMTLSWAPFSPATVTAESRLEGFEWQNGYPTAKIRETYSGPATFRSNSVAAPASGLVGTFQNIRYARVIYFAYNSGRLIRTETTVDFNANLGPDQISALGIGSSNAPTDTPSAPAPSPYAGVINNGPSVNMPDANGNLPGEPGYSGPVMVQQNTAAPAPQAPSAVPTGPPTPTHLKFTGVTTLLT